MKKSKLLLPFVMVTLLTACGADPVSASSSSSSSGNTSSRHEHNYEAHVSEPTCTEEGYTIYVCSCGDSYVSDYVDALWHNYVDEVCTRCGDTISNGATVEFGSYPQTLVSDTYLIAGLNTKYPDSDGIIIYEDAKYLKTTAENNVYGYDSEGNRITLYSASTTYFFEVKPITWKYYDGMLMAEKIIDASVFYPDAENARYMIKGTVFPNNYMYSTVRAYLNGLNGYNYNAGDYLGIGFIDKAFTEAEKAKILTTTVDNSAATTEQTYNAFDCADTQDKIFLPSYQDALNADYGFSTSRRSDWARVKKYTDYSIFRGYYYDESSKGAGSWWLRSPDYYYSYCACGVLSDGEVDSRFVSSHIGLSPALNLNIQDSGS